MVLWPPSYNLWLLALNRPSYAYTHVWNSWIQRHVFQREMSGRDLRAFLSSHRAEDVGKANQWTSAFFPFSRRKIGFKCRCFWSISSECDLQSVHRAIWKWPDYCAVVSGNTEWSADLYEWLLSNRVPFWHSCIFIHKKAYGCYCLLIYIHL